MIENGEAELMCDLAETYGIFDYRSLPPSVVATFALGLSDDSRIKMKLSERTIPTNTLILTAIYDRVNLLLWFNSEDGQKGENRPDSMLAKMMGIEKENEVAGFNTVLEFEEKRKILLGE